MVRRIDVTGAGGVRLAAWEYESAGSGGQSPGVLLLHGLLGRASHWAGSAGWLAERHRVIALDQRGHGASERPAGRYARADYVGDVRAVVEGLGLAPAVLIGHGLGALTAWQFAALHPESVRALVISDMRASALGRLAQREWVDWLRGWPLPFATLAEAEKWFAEGDPWLERPNAARGAYYTEALERVADGWRPVYEPEDMITSREAWVHDSHWDELAQVACPTLVLRGTEGELGRAEAQEMVRVLPRGEYAELKGVGHLAHFERQEEWRRAVEPFLAGALTS
jgi:pimeloyl-ACP methyl ester carboxylesterase